MADSVFLGSVYATAELRTDPFKQGKAVVDRELDSLDSSTKSKLASIGQSFTSAGKMLSIGLTAPLVLFGKQSVDTAVEIETKWAEVRKVYGSTAGAFERDSKMITSAVEDLTLKFGKSRGAVLDALSAISAIGYEGSTAVNVLTQSLEFATTGNMDLERAMNGVVAISKIYKIEGDKLRENLALLNTVENTTGASMADLAEAIEVAGASGEAAGVNIGELSGFVALLRERAVPAGEAANALKTILTRVYNVTDDAAEVYKKYGINIFQTEKYTGTFTKTIGGNADEVERLQKKLVSLNNSYNDYSAKISGVNMSDDERKKKLEELKSSMEAVSKSIADNSDVTETSTGTMVRNTGKFKDADVVLKELAVKWKDMTDAERFEVIQSNAGVWQKNKFISIMEDLSGKNSTYIKTLDAISDSTKNVSTYEKEMAVFLGTSAVKLQQNKAQWENLKIILGNILLEILLPIGTAFANLAKFISGLNPNVQKVIVIFGIFAALLGPILLIVGQIIVLFGGVAAVLGLTAGALLTAILPFVLIGAAIVALIAILVALWANWDKIAVFLQTTWSNVVTAVSEKWTAFTTWLAEATDKLVTGIITFFQKLPGAIFQVITDWILRWVEGFGMLVGLVVYGVPKLVDDIVNWFAALPGRLQVLWQRINDMWNKFWTGVKDFVFIFIPQLLGDIGAWFNQLPGMLKKSIDDTSKKATDGFNGILDAIVNILMTWPGKMYEWGKKILMSFADGINAAIGAIADAFKSGMNKAKELVEGKSPPIKGPFRDIDKWGYNVGTAWIEGVNLAVSRLQLPDPTASHFSVGQSAPAPINNFKTLSPAFTVNVGVYAGTEVEKRKLAKEFSNALADYERGRGNI